MAALVVCVCIKPEVPCDRTATQEDFLCDTCREGCGRIMRVDPEDLDAMIYIPHGSEATLQSWMSGGH